MNLTFLSLSVPNSLRFRYLGKYCRYTARCPLCASFGYTRTNCPSTKRICANPTQQHNVFFRGYLVYNFESEVSTLRFKHGLTLKKPISWFPTGSLGPQLALLFPLLHPILFLLIRLPFPLLLYLLHLAQLILLPLHCYYPLFIPSLASFPFTSLTPPVVPSVKVKLRHTL